MEKSDLKKTQNHYLNLLQTIHSEAKDIRMKKVSALEWIVCKMFAI